MFIKFDESGNVISFSDATDITEIRPDSTGFEPLPAGIQFDDIRFIRKINGQIMVDETAKAQFAVNLESERQIYDIGQWFVWYDNQVSQAKRAERTGVEWHAVNGTITYHSLAELDAEANNKQIQIRALRAQLQG